MRQGFFLQICHAFGQHKLLRTYLVAFFLHIYCKKNTCKKYSRIHPKIRFHGWCTFLHKACRGTIFLIQQFASAGEYNSISLFTTPEKFYFLSYSAGRVLNLAANLKIVCSNHNVISNFLLRFNCRNFFTKRPYCVLFESNFVTTFRIQPFNYIYRHQSRHLKKLTCKGTLRQVFIID